MAGKKHITNNRPTFRSAVEWVALNDNSGNGDSEDVIASYISVALVADLYGSQIEYVAKRVAGYRKSNHIRVGG